jgi:hypothetical protein
MKRDTSYRLTISLAHAIADMMDTCRAPLGIINMKRVRIGIKVHMKRVELLRVYVESRLTSASGIYRLTNDKNRAQRIAIVKMAVKKFFDENRELLADVVLSGQAT